MIFVNLFWPMALSFPAPSEVTIASVDCDLRHEPTFGWSPKRYKKWPELAARKVEVFLRLSMLSSLNMLKLISLVVELALSIVRISGGFLLDFVGFLLV